MGKKGRQENPKRLGAKLVSIRNSLALSQSGILRYLGVGEEYTREEVSAYERGVRTPPLHVILKYSKAVRVWVNVLIDDELDLPMELPAQSMHEGVPRLTSRERRITPQPKSELQVEKHRSKKTEGIKRSMKRRNSKP